ncbi:uncharacterized protein LOC124279452 [Haliotis rubra]|uniref:uncharacterized protein LOC124279452 n=1 Tax=Haliotis rubra TaxID=36100 RepID=UPI001EE5F8A4|nr:uncharacterized protein LOC124279452 [Haliotis rubra]
MNAAWKLQWVRIYESSEPGVSYKFEFDDWVVDKAVKLTHSTDCPVIPNCATQRCETCTTCKPRLKDVFFRLSPNKRRCQRCPVIPNCKTQICRTCAACNPSTQNAFFELSADKTECSRCPFIENCEIHSCGTCDTCNSPTENNVIFKLCSAKTKCSRSCRDMRSTVEMSLQWLSKDEERCDLTCSYVDNRWCWPGRCYNGLMTSCSCESGFRKSKNAMCDIKTKSELVTCNLGIEDHRSEIRNTTRIGKSTSCYSQRDVYINIQPESMSFKITAQFQRKGYSKQPVYIHATYIGIVDSSLSVIRKGISGSERILSSAKLRGGGDCSRTLSSSKPSTLVSCDGVLRGSSSLVNGEWLCGVIKVYSGGSFHYKNFHGHYLGNKRFTPLDESKTICFRYDNVAPVHCARDSRFPCSSDSPMRLSTRTTKSPNITVGVSGWVDPYPKSGKLEQASGIKYYKVDVYGMRHLGLDTLDVDYKKICV